MPTCLNLLDQFRVAVAVLHMMRLYHVMQMVLSNGGSTDAGDHDSSTGTAVKAAASSFLLAAHWMLSSANPHPEHILPSCQWEGLYLPVNQPVLTPEVWRPSFWCFLSVVTAVIFTLWQSIIKSKLVYLKVSLYFIYCTSVWSWRTLKIGTVWENHLRINSVSFACVI